MHRTEISAVSDPISATSAFVPHQLRIRQAVPPKQHITVVSNMTVPKVQQNIPNKLSMSIQKTVIAAPAKMATPEEIANKRIEVENAAKQSALIDSTDLDDDVTRALLAAAAGVTYAKKKSQQPPKTRK
ncbi:hypothetical protein Ciccas_004763 [Cichlidogyrus casuarinus]|uniref:Uncharacterized protein n=1 Tax=Cichlidogyrus casuarinus TaxID=1844966 RepID=A0ABD2QAM1_9PLAT